MPISHERGDICLRKATARSHTAARVKRTDKNLRGTSEIPKRAINGLRIIEYNEPCHDGKATPFQKSWAASTYHESSPPILTFGSKVKPIKRVLVNSMRARRRCQCRSINASTLASRGELLGYNCLGIALTNGTNERIRFRIFVQIYISEVILIALDIVSKRH